MAQTTGGGGATPPHYAKIVALLAVFWIAASLLMPFIIGPMGMVASGWTALAGAQPLMWGVLSTTFIGVLGGFYWLAPGGPSWWRYCYIRHTNVLPAQLMG